MRHRRRILVTGATGHVGRPLVRALAEHHDVSALARFTDPLARVEFEAIGVRCCAVDLIDPDFAEVPTDVDHVINLAADLTGADGFDRAIEVNAESLGLLLGHCRPTRSVLHCSSTAVYRSKGTDSLREGDPLGDAWGALMPTYSITKIAAEAVARTLARALAVPTTIARLNVPYGDDWGWPAAHLARILAGQAIHLAPGDPGYYAPIHADDMVRTVPALLDMATVPATIVNWGGSEAVSIREWATHLGELVGRPVAFTEGPIGPPSTLPDCSMLEAVAGRCRVGWQRGMARMVAALDRGPAN